MTPETDSESVTFPPGHHLARFVFQFVVFYFMDIVKFTVMKQRFQHLLIFLADWITALYCTAQIAWTAWSGQLRYHEKCLVIHTVPLKASHYHTWNSSDAWYLPQLLYIFQSNAGILYPIFSKIQGWKTYRDTIFLGTGGSSPWFWGLLHLILKKKGEALSKQKEAWAWGSTSVLS